MSRGRNREGVDVRRSFPKEPQNGREGPLPRAQRIFRWPDSLRNGRTVIGRIDDSDLRLGLRCPVTMNAEVAAVRPGASFSARARVVGWNGAGGCLDMDVVIDSSTDL